MPSLLLENITPPIVDSFSSHGSQFKFREWCETEPTIFRSYPRDKNVRPFITDLNQRQKNSSQLFQDRGGAGSKASTEPGSTPLMGGSEYFTSRFQTMAFIFHCN